MHRHKNAGWTLSAFVPTRPAAPLPKLQTHSSPEVKVEIGLFTKRGFSLGSLTLFISPAHVFLPHFPLKRFQTHFLLHFSSPTQQEDLFKHLNNKSTSNFLLFIQTEGLCSLYFFKSTVKTEQ